MLLLLLLLLLQKFQLLQELQLLQPVLQVVVLQELQLLQVVVLLLLLAFFFLFLFGRRYLQHEIAKLSLVYHLSKLGNQESKRPRFQWHTSISILRAGAMQMAMHGGDVDCEDWFGFTHRLLRQLRLNLHRGHHLLTLHLHWLDLHGKDVASRGIHEGGILQGLLIVYGGTQMKDTCLCILCVCVCHVHTSP